MAASLAIFSALSPINRPVDGSRAAGGTGTKSAGETFENALSVAESPFALLASPSARARRLLTVKGMSLALSAPPATATEHCPASIASAALVIAWKLVAHARL